MNFVSFLIVKDTTQFNSLRRLAASDFNLEIWKDSSELMYLDYL